MNKTMDKINSRLKGTLSVDAKRKIPKAFSEIDKLTDYSRVSIHEKLLERADIRNPFFNQQNEIPNEDSYVDNESDVNFTSYNYLGLCGHPAVSKAAIEAINQYGTSVSSSRIVGGEKDIHHKLERLIADLYPVEDALVMVSGHATNVTTIGHLFGGKDLILYDSLSHNSIAEGIKLSGAKAFPFPHNNAEALDQFLGKYRSDYEKVLVVTEGLFSMDGDTPPLKQLIEIKKRHHCFLMVDEAHSMGTLGSTGRGIAEADAIDPVDVDIWMGTLSKSFASCGGYIAGNKKLIHYLRYTAPGFVYSVGISPPLAAASLAAIQVMLDEPRRVDLLNDNCQTFFNEAKKYDLNVISPKASPVIPILTYKSIPTLKLHEKLKKTGILSQPIIYPAVSESACRLRFFISSWHRSHDIVRCVKILSDYIRAENKK